MEAEVLVVLIRATDGNIYQCRVTDLQKSAIYQVLRDLSDSGKIEVFDGAIQNLEISRYKKQDE